VPPSRARGAARQGADGAGDARPSSELAEQLVVLAGGERTALHEQPTTRRAACAEVRSQAEWAARLQSTVAFLEARGAELEARLAKQPSWEDLNRRLVADKAEADRVLILPSPHLPTPRDRRLTAWSPFRWDPPEPGAPRPPAFGPGGGRRGGGGGGAPRGGGGAARGGGGLHGARFGARGRAQLPHPRPRAGARPRPAATPHRALPRGPLQRGMAEAPGWRASQEKQAAQRAAAAAAAELAHARGRADTSEVQAREAREALGELRRGHREVQGRADAARAAQAAAERGAAAASTSAAASKEAERAARAQAAAAADRLAYLEDKALARRAPLPPWLPRAGPRASPPVADARARDFKCNFF
jgi:hypothetical protein